MILTLPAPPSTNAIWRAVKGRVIKSAEYRAWLTHAGLEIAVQRPKPIGGPVYVSIQCGDNKRRDLDGYPKPILDCLVANKLIDGDRWATVRDIHLSWNPDLAGVRVSVRSQAELMGEA